MMKYKILIIEDDKGIADAIASSISAWDMESRIPRDFHDIMPEFAEYSPHLVLLDIGLPFMDGYHWCREIRKLSSVPIIFISSAGNGGFASCVCLSISKQAINAVRLA